MTMWWKRWWGRRRRAVLLLRHLLRYGFNNDMMRRIFSLRHDGVLRRWCGGRGPAILLVVKTVKRNHYVQDHAVHPRATIYCTYVVAPM